MVVLRLSQDSRVFRGAAIDCIHSDPLLLLSNDGLVLIATAQYSIQTPTQLDKVLGLWHRDALGLLLKFGMSELAEVCWCV